MAPWRRDGAWWRRDGACSCPQCKKAALERAKGIEPSYAAWEAAVLPLNYARERPLSYSGGDVMPTLLNYGHETFHIQNCAKVATEQIKNVKRR